MAPWRGGGSSGGRAGDATTGPPDTVAWGRGLFVQVLVVAMAISLAAGPSSAILVIPSLGWWDWPAPADAYLYDNVNSTETNFYINATENRIWPARITKTDFFPSACPKNATILREDLGYYLIAARSLLALKLGWNDVPDTKHSLDLANEKAPRVPQTFVACYADLVVLDAAPTNKTLGNLIGDRNFEFPIRNGSRFASKWPAPEQHGSEPEDIVTGWLESPG